LIVAHAEYVCREKTCGVGKTFRHISSRVRDERRRLSTTYSGFELTAFQSGDEGEQSSPMLAGVLP
jgi:hypothetical protein